MVKFGGSEFIDCSVPLAFAGRYFILEPDPSGPLLSVVLDYQGKPLFEVYKNEPMENPVSNVSKTSPGIVAVADKKTNSFLYKVRPGSETSVVFGTIRGEEISASVTDRQISVGGITIQNCVFNGVGAGIVVDENGGGGIGGSIPQTLLQLFKLRV